MEGSANKTSPKTTKVPPDKGSSGIETGVIIMGLSCVCVVACALLLLQVRSASLQRRRRRRQQARAAAAVAGGIPAARSSSQDPLEANGPPTYDAVMRNPGLYPVSPRSSFSSTRRLSTASGLSQLSAAHLMSASQVSTETTSDDVNRSSSQDLSQLRTKDSDDEEQPPPYPGNVGSHGNEGGIPKANIHCVNAWVETRRSSPRNSIHSSGSHGNLGYESGCCDERGGNQGRRSVNSNHSNVSSNSRRSSTHSSNDRRGSRCANGYRGNLSREGTGLRISEPASRSRGNSVPGNSAFLGNNQELTVAPRTRRGSSDCRSHGNGLLGSDLLVARDTRRSRSLSSASGSTLLQPYSAWDENFPRELAFLPSSSSGSTGERRGGSTRCQCHCHKQT